MARGAERSETEEGGLTEKYKEKRDKKEGKERLKIG
jgi:hypothetical protein